ncbi:MAG: peptidoglycan-binding protein, partial [Oscillospiraceae bacterium]|nr:peptidoglycan-binding protein [Oscillospiraceae bacterium]
FDDVPNLKDWVFIRLSDSCFYETIEPSTWGDNVNFLQQILIRAGYQKAGTADGSYGPTTEKAVTEFQNDHGLPPTGVADNYTIHAILKAARGE